MKKLTILIAILLIFASGSFAQKTKNVKILIKQPWSLIKVDGEEATKKDRITLDFKKNGKLILKEIVENDIINGSWTISDDGKNIKMELNNEREVMEINIVSITKNSLSLNNNYSVAEFIPAAKIKKDKKTNRIEKNILGSWKTVNEENIPDMIIQFNSDGTAYNSESSRLAKWKIESDIIILSFAGMDESFKYTFSKDKKTLTLHTDRDPKIIKLERSTVKLEAPSEEKEGPEIDSPVTEKSDGINAEMIGGTWKITEMDSDKITDKKILMVLNEDNTFSISEDGEIARKGTWELKNGRLLLIDSDKQRSDYSLLMKDNVLYMNDYYGSIVLEKLK